MLEGKGEGGSQRGVVAQQYPPAQIPGSNPSLSQLGGTGGTGLQAHCDRDGGMYYFGRDTAEQLAAEGRPRGQKRDQRAHRYSADKTMRPLEWEAKTWVAAPGRD